VVLTFLLKDMYKIDANKSQIQTYDLHGTLSACLLSSWTNFSSTGTACCLTTQLESSFHLLALTSRQIHTNNGMGSQCDSVGQSQSCSVSTATESNVRIDETMTENCGIPSTTVNSRCRYGQMQTCRNSCRLHNWWSAFSCKLFWNTKHSITSQAGNIKPRFMPRCRVLPHPRSTAYLVWIYHEQSCDHFPVMLLANTATNKLRAV